jgi:phosphoglucosamine mutase
VNVQFFTRLGIALRRTLLAANPAPPHVLIGDDGRRSAASLRTALLAGLGDTITVSNCGTLSTAAIGHCVAPFGCSAGIVLTASHNGAGDNGVKFLRADGGKWSVGEELRLEALLRDRDREGERPLAPAVAKDCAREALTAYRDHWLRFFRKDSLAGLRIALDCANGATSAYAADLLRSIGAQVFPCGCAPNGYNINAGCGSEHPAHIARQTVGRRAQWGLALDGDGDRALICDGTGKVIAGEHLLAALAVEYAGPSPLVTTEQANGALDDYLAARGIATVRTAIGDRNVAEAVAADNCPIGGEPSGHVSFPAFGPLADGLVTGALFFMAMGKKRGGDCRFPLHPRAAAQIPTATRIPLEMLPNFSQMRMEIEKLLGGNGRMLARYSGTEPLLRLWVETEDSGTAEKYLSELALAFRRDIDGHKQIG